MNKLTAAQEQAGTANHSDLNGKVTADGLPWYVRVTAVPIPKSDPRYSEIQGMLGDKLVVLYDIKLLDTLTGTDYVMQAGTSAMISLSGLPIGGASGVAIVHQKADGTLEVITADVNGKTAVFSASSFSMYGVTAPSDGIPWLWVGVILIIAVLCIAVGIVLHSRKGKNPSSN
jgi:hypothetical protein